MSSNETSNTNSKREVVVNPASSTEERHNTSFCENSDYNLSKDGSSNRSN
jgi:hypothetical protein